MFFVLLALLGFQLTAQQRVLDETTFVVLGEGLAAGLSDFSLKSVHQDKSFPAQMARQMQTLFPQPLIQSPGIGNVPGFQALPIRIPATLQTTVREFPPNLFVFNLSVPGARISDTVHRRPVSPLIHQYDVQQTVTNLLIGFPALLLEGVPLWTQLEYAQQMNPTLALVELGYFEAIDAAVNGNPNIVPDAAAFRTDYSRIVAGLRANFAQVVLMTIPDPTETAFFSSQDAATRLVGAPASVIRSLYKLKSDDVLTINGIVAIGNQLNARAVTSLPPGSVLSAATADTIRTRVRALNTEITALAQQNGAVVYDLHTFFTKLKSTGVLVGTRTLTAEYLGGFYSLNGYYPGSTGHALIANEVLDLLNKTYGRSFPMVNAVALLATDPAAAVPANSFLKREYTLEELEEFIPNLKDIMREESFKPDKSRRSPEGGRQ